MKDMVLKEIKTDLESFIKERIEENEELFSKGQIKDINNNRDLINKIYLLGFINARECYKKQD